MMRNSINASLLTILLSCSSVFGQSKASQMKSEAVVVPQEAYLSVIVAQPNCPLRIEKVSLLRFLDGGFGELYYLRNIGDKPVRSYSVAIWNSDNTGDIIDWHANNNDELLKLNQTSPSNSQDTTTVTIPLSDELRKKLDLKPPLKKIVFFMIIEIEFIDGTKYNAKPLFNELKKHLSYFEPIYEKET